jgi:hypothetical protein
VTLLNERMKETYDRGLRDSLSKAAPGEAGQRAESSGAVRSEDLAAASAGVGEDDLADFDEWGPAARTDLPGARTFRPRKQLDPVSVLIAGASVLGLAACIWFVTASTRPESEPSAPPPAVAERAEAAPISKSRTRPRTRSPRPDGGGRTVEPETEKFTFKSREDASSEKSTDEMAAPVEATDDVGKQAPDETLLAASSSASSNSDVVETIDLDLDVRRQKHKLGNSVPLRYRVIALRGCEAIHAVVPEGGVLAENSDVTIVVAGVRDVRIHLELRSVNASEASILVSAVVVNDEGNEIPFNLQKMEAIGRDILKQEDEAALALENLHGESEQIKGWMDSGGAKPLADVKAARARVAEIKELIPEQEAFVKSLAADLEVAESLRMLAVQLHERGTIEIAAGE